MASPFSMDEANLIDALIDRIYAAALDPALWGDFLELLRHTAPGAKTVLFFHDEQVKCFTPLSTSGFDPGMLQSYGSHYAAMNPWMPEAEKRLPGDVFAAEALVESRELRKTEFYHDWLRPQDLHRGPSALLLKEEGRNMILSVLHAGKEDATEETARVRLLSQLAKHMRRAAEVHRTLKGARLNAILAASGANALPVGVFVLSRDGKCLWQNQKAERLAEQQDALALTKDERVQLRERTANRALQEALARYQTGLHDHDLSRVIQVPRPKGARGLLLRILLVRLADQLGLSGGESVIVLLFHDLAEAPMLSGFRQLARLWGLTPAEEAVALEIVQGYSLREIAEKSGRSIETVRKHLKAVQAKSGCSRQPDLIHLVLTSAPLFGDDLFSPS